MVWDFAHEIFRPATAAHEQIVMWACFLCSWLYVRAKHEMSEQLPKAQHHRSCVLGGPICSVRHGNVQGRAARQLRLAMAGSPVSVMLRDIEFHSTPSACTASRY